MISQLCVYFAPWKVTFDDDDVVAELLHRAMNLL